MDAPARVFPLRRVAPGRWMTRDSLWELVADPNGYTELGIGSVARAPRQAWFVYPKAGRHVGVDDSLPVFVGNVRAWPTLREAAGALRDAKFVDVEPL